MGPAQPGPGSRRPRVPEADQLEGSLRPDTGPDQPRRCLGHQGLRHGVLLSGLPPDAGGHGPRRGDQARIARGDPAGTPGAGIPRHSDTHLRGRHQRDPAGPHQRLWPGDAGAALMDLSYTPDQESLRSLARQVLSDHATPQRVAEVEASEDRIDRELWAALAAAGLLGVSVPEEHGGSGLGIVELCILLEEVGRAVAPVPVYATLALGALPIAEFGSAEQRRRLLPGVVTGELLLSGALAEPLNPDPRAPVTRARPDGDG